MPINKDKERFLQNKIPYEMISREVAQSLSNPDALAIWVYLMAKPPTWIVRREDIRSHFSIGRDRYSKAMSELNEAGLVVTKNVQGADGKIVSRSFTVEATLTHMRPDNHSVGKPTQRDLGHCGETDHIDNKRLLREKDIEGRSPTKRFKPPTVAEVSEYCKELGNGVDANRFVDFYESKGWMVGKNKMKCWKAAMRTWSRNNKATVSAQAVYL